MRSRSNICFPGKREVIWVCSWSVTVKLGGDKAQGLAYIAPVPRLALQGHANELDMIGQTKQSFSPVFENSSASMTCCDRCGL